MSLRIEILLHLFDLMLVHICIFTQEFQLERHLISPWDESDYLIFLFFSYLSDKCPKFALKFLHLLKDMKIKPVAVKLRVHLFLTLNA